MDTLSIGKLFILLLKSDNTVSTSKPKCCVSETISFFQLNLHHCQLASALLNQQTVQLDTVVAVVWEPWTNKGQTLGLQSKGSCMFRGIN